ncbi:MAG: patatin-like phospholipase family protein [Acidimicrobiales bacterium]
MLHRRPLPAPFQGALRSVVARLPRRRTTAFLFSGGGNLGAVQIGMLRALVEAGIVPDLVIGCSVGAINGAGFAADPTLRGVARLERIWRRLADGNPELMPGGFMPLAVQLARKGENLHDPSRLELLLEEQLPAESFADLRIPFHCVATDLHEATEHWFHEGPLVPALMASAALPAVYPARQVAGRTLIDGGVLNEVHTARAVELGANELYVLHVGHLGRRPMTVQRPFDSAMRAYWTARRYRLEDDLRRIPPGCAVHRLPAGVTPRLRFDDFSQGPDLADIAYEQTAEYLRTGRLPEEEIDPAALPAEAAFTAEESTYDIVAGTGDRAEGDDDLDTWPVTDRSS